MAIIQMDCHCHHCVCDCTHGRFAVCYLLFAVGQACHQKTFRANKRRIQCVGKYEKHKKMYPCRWMINHKIQKLINIINQTIMVTFEHSPQLDMRGNITFDDRYVVKGEKIDEIITELVSRIRPKSKDFYRENLYNDLTETGKSIVDHHAGLGILYVVELLNF